jgi:diguanylate cyclase (GGDEF)-like protein/PAS domain S-box-containing protein
MKLSAPTILIVDDELLNCKLLVALLKPEGYLTLIASGGEEALVLIAERQPDLILLDIMMPGMDGYITAKTIKADPATRHIPIIMVTAMSDRDARLAGLEAGAEEFLTKPIDRTELWLRVRNLLRLKSFGDLLKSQSQFFEQLVQERTADLQRFRTAMDATADAIFLIERTSMRFIEVNATACNMFGYTREEFLDLCPTDLGGVTLELLTEKYDMLIASSGKTQLQELRLRRKDGSQLQVELNRQALRSGDDRIIVGVVRDITERKEAQQRLHRLAHFDGITGLPNRTLFYDSLKQTLVQAAEKGWQVAVLFIDLDNFKNVNDTLGHAFGDELLSQFGTRLVQCVRVRDTVGRLGGDEFAVILVLHAGIQGATKVASKIQSVLEAPFLLNAQEIAVTASIGITMYPDDAGDADTLIRYADTAMYRAKQAGRATYRFFTAQMNAEVLERLDLEAALRKAIENEEFVLHYQPKVQINSGKVVGLEALLRWQRPGHGLIAPNEFIPVLEETGQIVRVGSWVIDTVCKQIAAWMRSTVGPLQVSVNVSGRQFLESDLEIQVMQALAANGVPGELLEVELWESSLMANTARTIVTLHNLKKHGVKISIDDFGTGYSSLAYLRRFPIDKLKIDIAFIRDITTNPDDAAIALAIIGLAHTLKMEVIAEGVETAEQLAYLRRHGCDQIQGYYFSRPLALVALEQLLHEGRGLPVEDVALRLQPH